MPPDELEEELEEELLEEELLEEDDDVAIPQKSASGSNETPLSQTEIHKPKNTLHVGVPSPLGQRGTPELH